MAQQAKRRETIGSYWACYVPKPTCFNSSEIQEMTQDEKKALVTEWKNFEKHHDFVWNCFENLKKKVNERITEKVHRIMVEAKKKQLEEEQKQLDEEQEKLHEKQKKLLEEKRLFEQNSGVLASSNSLSTTSSSSGELSSSLANNNDEIKKIVEKQVIEWRMKGKRSFHGLYVCPYVFCKLKVFENDLEEHIRNHLKETNKYKSLENCYLGFSFGHSNLPQDTEEEKELQNQVHKQIHTWKNQFSLDSKCPVEGCDKEKIGNISSHLTSHIKKFPYLCKVGTCQEQFKLESYRFKHRRDCNGGQKKKRKWVEDEKAL